MSAAQPPANINHILHRSMPHSFTMCREEKCAMATRLKAWRQRRFSEYISIIYYIRYTVYIHPSRSITTSSLHHCPTAQGCRGWGLGGKLGGWSKSQLWLDERQGKPWTSWQFITWLKYMEKETTRPQSHLQAILSHQFTKDACLWTVGEGVGHTDREGGACKLLTKTPAQLLFG